jgi:hypothetical protein
VILGYEHVDTLTELVDTAAQERVGEWPADDNSTASENKKDPAKQKQLLWADVVAGKATHHHKKTNKPSQEITFSKQSS